MPFTNNFGLSFNCGYCRTFIHEKMPKMAEKTAKKKDESSKVTETGSTSQSDDAQSVASVADGEVSRSDKVCLDVGEHFRELFVGPQFAIGDDYFKSKDRAPRSAFEEHRNKVRSVFLYGFHCLDTKKTYVKTFSSAKWEALSQSEKSKHSLSNCVACATQFEQLQKDFPLKPFYCPPQNEKENMPPTEIRGIVRQATGVPFTEIAANLGYKSTAVVKRMVGKAEKKGFREGQKKCISEISSQLERSALPAAYSTNTSINKFEKLRKAQFYELPNEKSSKKKRFALRPDECENHAELCQALKDWDSSKKFVGTELARTFNAKGSDSSHKIKLLAQEENSSIPGLEIVPRKRKVTKVKLTGTSRALSMPVPPTKKRMAEIDRSLVDSGVLKEGIPCVPVKLVRFHMGVPVEIVAESRKFPLKDIRKSLLNVHEPFMRLHSDCEVNEMCKEDILAILRHGACHSMDQFQKATLRLEELKCVLTKFERNRTLWIWHDHSCLASHGVFAVMIGVVYDPIVFKTESELARSVQEFVEEGEIHIVAHGTSTLNDQATLIPERLAELDGLTDEVTSNSGITIIDTVRFFKGDKPAAEFEAGVSHGGNYPCVGCTCHYDRFADYPHAVSCKQRSLKGIQEMALGGHYGRVPGKMRFYEELSTEQLRVELEKRAIMDYKSSKKDRLASLKGHLCGVQRVPSLLMFTPETPLSELHLSSYCVLPCEPLHDLKGYIEPMLRKLPSILPESEMKTDISVYLATVWKKTHRYGSDLREALMEVAHIFANHSAKGPASDYITYLVQVSRILYSKDSGRSPKQCLQFYNCAYMVHELHCALFGEVHTSLYFHALLIHGPVQHEIVCCRSTNTESEERIFKTAESAAMCTDRKPEHLLPIVLKRLQFTRASKKNNPLQSLQQANSRIASSARKLPPFMGTIFETDFVVKRVHSYQAHLQRIGHFLVQGEGVWWHKTSNGSFHFHDSYDDVDSINAGPQLLHFRNAKLEDVLKRSNDCWQEALERKAILPIHVLRHFDSHGDVSEIATTEEPNAISEPEVSFEGSFTVPTLPPPETSTPVRGHEPAFVEASLPSEEHEAMPEEEECAQDEEGVQPLTTEGFVDMALAEEVSETPHSALQSSVCKAVAKILGVTPELQEFDRIRSLCRSEKSVPVTLERHKALASHFRKQISTHKRGLECRLAELYHSSDEYSQCAKDIQLCLKLIVRLH